LRIGRFEGGRYALILLCQAVVNDSKYHFVTYLSRGPYELNHVYGKDQNLSELTEQDFHDLRTLSEQFRQKLRSETRKRFNVVSPLALGKVSYDGKNYAFFTMPFVPRGEINIESQDFSKKGEIRTIPYFRYAIPWSAQMQKTKLEQEETVLSFGRKVLSGDLNENELKNTQEYNTMRNQLCDLAIGEMLIHLVSNGKFPTNHLIGAGDWMGVISAYGLKLTLISCRGGLELISKDAFLERLRAHKDIAYCRERTSWQPVFNVFSPDQMKQLYNIASHLIVNDNETQ